jgi:hypothetical protein
MLYYIIKIEWSQTDHEMCIVQAPSREAALALFKSENGPRYVSCYGEVEKITKVTLK